MADPMQETPHKHHRTHSIPCPSIKVTESCGAPLNPPSDSGSDLNADSNAPSLDEIHRLVNLAFHTGARTGSPHESPRSFLSPEHLPSAQETPKSSLFYEPKVAASKPVSPLSTGSTLRPDTDKGASNKIPYTINREIPTISKIVDQFDYGSRFARSAMGQELNHPKSRFWRVYLDETSILDANLLRQNGDTLDGLLVFGGLFSAVLTTFLVQVSQALEKDYGKTNALLMVEILQVQRAVAEDTSVSAVPSTASDSVTETFIPALSVRWATSLWFISLTLSLATAMIALLARQWLHSYAVQTTGSARRRAEIRQLRFIGLDEWKVPQIIRALPLVLHLSLAFFFVGLVVYLEYVNLPVLYLVVGLVGVTFTSYFIATILPLIYPRCPYRTPLTFFGYQCLSRLRQAFWRSSSSSTPPTCIDGDLDLPYIDHCSESIDTETISWLYTSSSNPTVKLICIEATAGLPPTYSAALTVSDAMIGDIGSEIQSMDSSLDAEGETSLEVLLRAYVLLAHQPRPISYKGSNTAEWTESRLVRSLSFLRCQNLSNPQLDAALCSIGFYLPIDITQKLIGITTGPSCTTLHLHPIIWTTQFLRAHASGRTPFDFLLASEFIKILVSVDYFDTRRFLSPSNITSTRISEPTSEMADAMLDYVWRSSPSAIPYSTQARSSCALLAYMQSLARHIVNSNASIDFEAPRFTLSRLRHTIIQEGKESRSLSHTLHTSYRETLLFVASYPSFAHAAATIDARRFLGYVFSDIYASTLSKDYNHSEHHEVSDSRHNHFGTNLLQFMVTYDGSTSPTSEHDAWALYSSLCNSGSTFIIDTLFTDLCISGFYKLFHASMKEDGPNPSSLIVSLLSGFLRTKRKHNTLKSDLQHIHTPDNLFMLSIMILYEERSDLLMELIAAVPSRFHEYWRGSSLRLLKWSLEKDLCDWPKSKRIHARETIEDLYTLFHSGFVLSDDCISDEYGFLLDEDELDKTSPVHGATNDTQAHSCPVSISNIWSSEMKYKDRLAYLKVILASQRQQVSERVWHDAVADPLDSNEYLAVPTLGAERLAQRTLWTAMFTNEAA